ncbi:MAG: hypothetical protein OXH07_11285 [Chloroflexi bacterium]|nr:hypothetical protein [Chloroflexota bacterium]
MKYLAIACAIVLLLVGCGTEATPGEEQTCLTEVEDTYYDEAAQAYAQAWVGLIEIEQLFDEMVLFEQLFENQGHQSALIKSIEELETAAEMLDALEGPTEWLANFDAFIGRIAATIRLVVKNMNLALDMVSPKYIDTAFIYMKHVKNMLHSSANELDTICQQ